MKCILCESKNTKRLEVIAEDDLIALYKRAFGIEVGHIIKSDVLYWHCEVCDLRFFSLEDSTLPCGDDGFYNALNKLEWYYMSEKREYHFASKFIDASSRVLEVGCGKAAFSSFISNKANYTGLELSSDAKKMALESGIDIKNIFVEDFAKKNTIPYDVSCSFQVLEHVSNPKSFIESQIKCLDSKIGGGQQAI